MEVGSVAALKDEFSIELIEQLGFELVSASREFPMQRWTEHAGSGLDDMELLERVNHLAHVLAECLPQEFPEAAGVLDTALESESFTGWMTQPCGKYVADAGIDHPHVALPLLAGLTPRFSSEFPIRFFIEAHPEITFEYLHKWTKHPDDHVRRLVSEGTRPRLPWASRLRGLIDDPCRGVELLEKLFDDRSEYVRRSVANHLNDISKDHPALAVDLATRWLSDSTHGDWVVRRGLRSLVKQGHTGALGVLGFDFDTPVVATAFSVLPPAITIGDTVTISAELVAERSTKAAVDYVVHYQGVRGPKDGKVFKLKTSMLGPEPTSVEKRHTFKHVSIRTIHPGPHKIELQVNGAVVGSTVIDVSVSCGGGPGPKSA